MEPARLTEVPKSEHKGKALSQSRCTFLSLPPWNTHEKTKVCGDQ